MAFARVALTATLAAFCLLAGATGDILPGEKHFDSRWATIEKAFEASREGHDLASVKEELRRFFGSSSQDTKALGLRWIGYRSSDLTAEEIDELSRFFVELNPTNTLSEGVRAEMANRHLAAAGVDRRIAVYMTAVREGSVMFENSARILRSGALVRAAAEGMTGFRPLIEQYRVEIDGVHSTEPYRYSDRLLWMLELRQGAKDRNEAIRLHAQRLAEMKDERFFQLMEADSSFRAATKGVMIEACEKPLAPPCLDIGLVVLRQAELRERQRDPGVRKQQEEAEQSDWLSGLQGLTAAARAKISRERVEAQSKPQP